MQARKRRKHPYAAPIGGLFLLLAALGAVAVVTGSLNLTFRMLDNTTEKKEFEALIQPVLMFDPVPFEDPADIKMDSLLQYSMWATLLSGKYDFSAGGEMWIPASDLDVAANKLFYTEEGLVLEHHSFGEILSTFYYDDVTESYSVPISADLSVYSPSVEEIEKVGMYYRLKVGYVSPSSPWTAVIGGGSIEPEPDKHMYYYMVASSDGYQLAKVEDVPSETAASQEPEALPGAQPEQPAAQEPERAGAAGSPAEGEE